MEGHSTVAGNVLSETVRQLEYFFKPRGVALVGASREPGKVGHELMKNLIEYGYKGAIYPVNPKADEILGYKCYKSVLEIPGVVDLAVIMVPAAAVPSVLEECGQKGVRAIQIISSGFKEVGNVELEKQIVDIARKYGMRIIGPNTFGLVYTPNNLNASFGPREVLKGSICFITQSGALGIALMGWTILEEIGLSGMVSEGNKCDVDEADLLEYFMHDENTKVITIYMEGLAKGGGRRFVEVAKKVTKLKPIIVVKGGRSERGERAVASHTGSIAGSDRVFDAAFKQCGVIRALTLEQMFDWARVCALQPPPKGENAIIITNGGGAGVQATDTCEDYGVNLLQPLPDDLASELRRYMPPFGSTRNPVDLTGQAPADAFSGAVYTALKHPNIDSVIVLYCRVAVLEPIDFANAVLEAVDKAASEGIRKTIVAGLVGGADTLDAIRHLNRRGIPSYPSAERASAALGAYYRWVRWAKK